MLVWEGRKSIEARTEDSGPRCVRRWGGEASLCLYPIIMYCNRHSLASLLSCTFCPLFFLWNIIYYGNFKESIPLSQSWVLDSVVPTGELTPSYFVLVLVANVVCNSRCDFLWSDPKSIDVIDQCLPLFIPNSSTVGQEYSERSWSVKQMKIKNVFVVRRQSERLAGCHESKTKTNDHLVVSRSLNYASASCIVVCKKSSESQFG